MVCVPVLGWSSGWRQSVYVRTGELVALEGPAENKLDPPSEVPGETLGVAVTEDVGVMGSVWCCWCSFKRRLR